jgi:hypothetical protein
VQWQLPRLRECAFIPCVFCGGTPHARTPVLMAVGMWELDSDFEFG